MNAQAPAKIAKSLKFGLIILNAHVDVRDANALLTNISIQETVSANAFLDVADGIPSEYLVGADSLFDTNLLSFIEFYKKIIK